MKLMIMTLLSLISLQSFAYKGEFPIRPDSSLTPGSLCDRPDRYRYEEHFPPRGIAYCERDVSTQTKDYIFTKYRRLGYRIGTDRSSYKIDHFIPLCAGGSNREDNLWPQHVSIFQKTDKLEEIGCKQLKAGKINQANLVKLYRLMKNDLSKVPQVHDYLINL